MEPLLLPPFSPRLRDSDGQRQIFDRLRRKFVALTPEEWVRQTFVNYLIEHKGYPPSLLANEVALTVGNRVPIRRAERATAGGEQVRTLHKAKTIRADTVLFDASLHARMIVEYKAPSITINEKVLEQALAYNTLLHVDYLIVSNGRTHHCCRVDYAARRCVFLGAIPDYSAL